MKLRLILLSVMSLALASGAGWYIYQAVHDSGASTSADAPPAPPPAVQTVNGETVVVVSPEGQRASHIKVAPLAAATSQSGISAYATVIDLQPLFDLRNRLASARGRRHIHRAGGQFAYAVPGQPQAVRRRPQCFT
jgi:membrane fusion protein, multidrug efflux system